MKLSQFVIVKLTLLLIIGTCIGFYINLPVICGLVFSFALLTILFFTYRKEQKSFSKSIAFEITTVVLSIWIGILNVQIHDASKHRNHYLHYPSEINQITFKVREVLKSGRYHDKYVVKLLKINNEYAKGSLLLNLEKDSTTNRLHIDDIYSTASPLSSIAPPLNPGEFNYKAYLKQQYIYKQIFTTPLKLKPVALKTHSILGWSDRIKRYVQHQLKQYPFGDQQLAIINALLLGERRDISNALYNNYTKAGAVHILAVSGLHIGILLLLLNVLLNPVSRLKHGKAIKTLILLILLWMFAVLTGLSASVTRATTMFSLIAIALNWNRKTNIYNTLAISVFILLLIKPSFLKDIGFQLSYLAVLGIVSFQPKLRAIWYPKHKALQLLWNTATVTLAAQIGVLPISLYYFHQFPGLFFVTNIVVIPFLGIILGLGVLVLILAATKLLPLFLATSYNNIITYLNDFISWVAQQDRFIFDNISIHFNTVLAIYGYLICVFIWYINKRFKTLATLLLSLIILQSVCIYNASRSKTNEWVIFHKSRKSILGIKSNNRLQLMSTMPIAEIKTDKTVRNYAISRDIKTIHYDSLASVYMMQNQPLLIIDSLGVYATKTFKPDKILLINSPKLNINRLIDSLQPKQIIADGSNYKSYIARWEATCKTKKLPFFYTGKTGAYLVKTNN